MAGAARKKRGTMLRAGGIVGDPKGPLTPRQKTRLAKKHLERMHAEHPCGSCSACCTVKEVEAIGKPEGQPCENLAPSGSGCRVYAHRPQPCRDYFCAYRHGLLGGESRRPDHLGLLFDVAERPPPGIMMLAVREYRAGALDDSDVQGVLHEIAATGLVLYLIKGDRRFFMGPEERVQACREWARRSLPLVAR